MRKYRFYKNEMGWSIDLKWFPFNKAWLLMVAGADTLLDILSKGKNEVTLEVSTSPILYSTGVLEKEDNKDIKGIFQGRVYESKYVDIKSCLGSFSPKHSLLWLCPTTLVVFWKYPKKIYYKTVEQ